MKRLLKSMFFLEVSLILFSCHPDDNEGKDLAVRNNSSERIYYWYSADYSTNHYPDTILPTTKPVHFGSVAPKSMAGVSGYDPNYSAIFSALPEGLLSIYFFDEPAENQEEWEDLKSNNFLLRKDVTYDELKSNNYIIEFP